MAEGVTPPRAEGPQHPIVLALEAHHDRVSTEIHLYQLLSAAKREPDKVKRAMIRAQAMIDQAEFYIRSQKRGAMEPLDPDIFK